MTEASASVGLLLATALIFVHISGSAEPITLIWASLERPFPLTEFELQMMPILVKGDDVRSGTKANARHGR